jgi:hypothetical protein
VDLACSRWVLVDPDGREGSHRIVWITSGMIKMVVAKQQGSKLLFLDARECAPGP